MRQIFLAAIMALVLTGCSLSGDKGGESKKQIEEAYRQGRSDVGRLIDKKNTREDVCDLLLEMRAREFEIQTNVGVRSAESYLKGVEEALKESGDTLYTTLFK